MELEGKAWSWDEVWHTNNLKICTAKVSDLNIIFSKRQRENDTDCNIHHTQAPVLYEITYTAYSIVRSLPRA